jgi:hypothetical protein
MLPMLTNEKRNQVTEQVINEMSNKITNYLRSIEGINQPVIPHITELERL